MKKIKISTLALLLSAASIQTGYATTYEELPKEVKKYMLEMDNMTFKQLRDLALVNKESKEQVVNYFKQRLERLKNTACPVLTQEVLEQGKLRIDQPLRWLQTDTPSLFSPARDPGYATYIVVIKDDKGNDIKWAIKANIMDLLELSEQKGLQLQSSSAHITPGRISSSKQLGPIIMKECTYPKDSRSISLFIYDEFLVLEGLELPK